MFSRNFLVFFAVVIAVAVFNVAASDLSDDEYLQLVSVRGIIRENFKPMTRDCVSKAAKACVKYWLNKVKAIECAKSYFNEENPTCLA